MTTIRIILLCGFALAASIYFAHAQSTGSPAQTSADDLAVMLLAIEQTPPAPAAALPDSGTYWSAQHAPGSDSAWPPLPANFWELSAWPLGDGFYLLDDLDFSYPAPETDTGLGAFSPMLEAQVFTTNDLWLEITSLSNQTASLVIHPPWGDTNLSHDLNYAETLTPPIQWQFVMRCPYTNAVVTDLCPPQGFFRLGPATNGNLTVSNNVTAQ